MGCPEAYGLGLVQEVTPPGKELDRAIDLANKIAAAAPLGVRAALTGSRRPSPPMKPRRSRRCRPNFERVSSSEDAKEFQRALEEGLRPVYRGL